ncbi:cytochrome c biogenesis CcdA family protein [Marinithermus hydrothermalis]|uniref:Cytochrome c biogenesis protein transmembrane region n=1 Tax=Marinithermus hydrothermalis (strain DSM 14884 / JCM 11576 / T1) TaxID=869210 RepID=F2NM89_MARHT|nr:cytochrome c biogenesis protein CcdA [Marinithermus hydrothermalis]AEB11777.1 cytochrome c biogenesis protein transmembrane region [Marinithermus hydrothermalis DSM 14884]
MSRWLLRGLLAALVLIGGGYLALGQPRPDFSTAWLEAHPLLAFLLAGTAGFADGLNPCAIATLLLFMGALTVVVERASRSGNVLGARAYVWSVAGAYILGIFLLYFTLGAGFVEVTSLRVFGNTHVFTRIAGLIAVVLGLVMIAEVLYPGIPVKLSMPAGLHRVARRWGRRTTAGAALVGGVLIGVCTIPCGGAMYLAVAALIGGVSSKLYAYSLLLVYNLAFVLPLVLLVAVGSSRSVLRELGRLHIVYRSRLKLGLGAFVVLVGLFALW